MNTSQDQLRAERAGFIDNVNLRRVARGRRPLRRYVLTLPVVAEGFTRSAWFCELVVEMARRARWFVGEWKGERLVSISGSDTRACPWRMLRRLGPDWVQDARYNEKVEAAAPHFCVPGIPMIVPWWLPHLRRELPSSERAAAIRFAMSDSEILAAIETTMRLGSSPGSVRRLIRSFLASRTHHRER